MMTPLVLEKDAPERGEQSVFYFRPYGWFGECSWVLWYQNPLK
jgi:hypothetical protein